MGKRKTFIIGTQCKPKVAIPLFVDAPRTRLLGDIVEAFKWAFGLYSSLRCQPMNGQVTRARTSLISIYRESFGLQDGFRAKNLDFYQGWQCDGGVESDAVVSPSRRSRQRGASRIIWLTPSFIIILFTFTIDIYLFINTPIRMRRNIMLIGKRKFSRQQWKDKELKRKREKTLVSSEMERERREEGSPSISVNFKGRELR